MEKEHKTKRTLVLGGSLNPGRYANKAIRRLRSYGHAVVSIGNKEGTVEDVVIMKETPFFNDLHTITVYLSAKNQKQYYDYIIGMQPERIIFNPGAENPELAELAGQHDIEVVEHCTLILLDTHTF
jgi:predicted CoA-binding protein